jgi:phospholipid/cholesterol/gamma-HCH transport system permease protein
MATVEPAEPIAAEPGPLSSFLASVGDLTAFSAEAIRELPRTGRFVSEILRQTALLVRGSTFFLFLMTSFIGFSLASVGYFFLGSAGAADFVGVFTGLSTPRASTPFMFGYVFAAKVGCGMVAEIGVMRINEEIDGLESVGVNPMRYVVGTRVIAALLFVPIAVGVAIVAVTGGVYVDTVWVLQALPGPKLMADHWGAMNPTDLVGALLTMGTTAIAIVLVSCYFGYRVSGGPAQIGRAVASSLIVNLVLVHVIVTVWISLLYGPDPKLPFGG